MNILNENISKKIVVIIISIFIVSVLLLSTTYSLIYNTKKLSKNTYTTGVLDIQYTEGDTLELNNYIPMNDEAGMLTEPYTITITNTGTLTYKFNLNILSTVIDTNKIIDAEYIVIQIDENEPVKLSTLLDGKIYSNLILKAQESMEINIRMWLSEDTPNSQMGNIYSAKLLATGLAIQNNSLLIHSTTKAYQTLVKLGLDKYVTTTLENDIIEIESENGYLYYFKGDIDYNYVLFNDKYYRIILIDTDGNIKMMYAGTKPYDNGYDDQKLQDTIIGNVAFNINQKEKSGVGYTFLDEDFHETDSTVKLALEKWYEENINGTSEESEIIDTIYCNDRRELSMDIGNSQLAIANTVFYNSYNRIIEKNEVDLSCMPSDSYMVSTKLGNGSLKYPVGLITADELLLTGSEYLNNNVEFWTMTSAKYENNISYNFTYNNKLNIVATDESKGIRPVITIKPDNISGVGSQLEPYKIVK